MSDLELDVLRFIGHRLPRLPHASALINRFLKPLYLRKRRAPVVRDVLGAQMELDPSEAVDGNLLFCPQLYDAAEIAYLQSHLREDDTFVDVGAHIGFYSLMAAQRVRRGVVVAIEAAPPTFAVLEGNIRRNAAPVTALQCGVSDRAEPLALHLQEWGNRGGNSFVAREGPGGQGRSVEVPCVPLLDVLQRVGVTRIAGLKIDVEGFEDRVLRHFFANAPGELWPRFVITEFYGGDHLALLTSLGYREVLRTATNRILSSDGI